MDHFIISYLGAYLISAYLHHIQISQLIRIIGAVSCFALSSGLRPFHDTHCCRSRFCALGQHSSMEIFAAHLRRKQNPQNNYQVGFIKNTYISLNPCLIRADSMQLTKTWFNFKTRSRFGGLQLSQRLLKMMTLYNHNNCDMPSLNLSDTLT